TGGVAVARPTLFTHPKFRRLCHVLGEPVPHVLGYLELMWAVAYESGNPRIGDAVDVELAAQYPPGKEGRLCAALLQVGFLDDVNAAYHVTDLADHCPEYGHLRAKKEREREKEKTCDHCSATFHSTEAHAKYCSDACRQAGHRQRVTERNGGVRNS